jgi:hypothetical protein
LDTSFEIIHSLDQLVLDTCLGPALPLDPVTVPPGVEAKADRPGEAVSFPVDRGLVLAD